MATLKKLALVAMACGFFGMAGAQTLQMEGMARDASAPRPTRGMTEASVQARFGSPVSREAAVGDPPISRWHYQDFIVYFEYDRVIHAVTKR
ncbi:MAG: hypothetical protein OEN22_00730 [Gammaproteobacteria bacterium]|nr:hypothetical protein [Gammaproteobacteria bacterium]